MPMKMGAHKRIFLQQEIPVIPMKMGIHHKPIGQGYLALLDSRLHGNDGGTFFPRKHLSSRY